MEGSNQAARALVLVVLAAGIAACGRKVECTTEITAGAGTYKATARGEGEEAPIARNALRDACERMCVATKAPMLDACTARCTVDVGAAKIGAKTSCTP
ncbi:hypothetical protein [Polyangium aurulentum]|uniref:hypothetical protein n=1 Tax=Polyangium aurulentum TaxID=2567896 RepID=UPI0010AE7A4D|nr:hypothetical protein [Polyangium aurulentum]UQA61097.1 hypothetical protein E8A73_011710 [Polyangium aurulentum]